MPRVKRRNKKSRGIKTKREEGFRKRNHPGRKPLALAPCLVNSFQLSPIEGRLSNPSHDIKYSSMWSIYLAVTECTHDAIYHFDVFKSIIQWH